MRAFLSYSTKDRLSGGLVKDALASLGIDAFLAHETLRTSEDWKKRILQELGRCELFIPLLSRSFRASDWCAQETGAIYRRRGVIVVPLSLDKTKPYGFIASVQGHQFRENEIEERVLDSICAKSPVLAIEASLKGLRDVRDYRKAERLIRPIAEHFDQFTEAQARAFAAIAGSNAYIWDANLCRAKLLPEFLKANKDRIGKTANRIIKHQIRTGTRYELAA